MVEQSFRGPFVCTINQPPTRKVALAKVDSLERALQHQIPPSNYFPCATLIPAIPEIGGRDE